MKTEGQGRQWPTSGANVLRETTWISVLAGNEELPGKKCACINDAIGHLFFYSWQSRHNIKLDILTSRPFSTSKCVYWVLQPNSRTVLSCKTKAHICYITHHCPVSPPLETTIVLSSWSDCCANSLLASRFTHPVSDFGWLPYFT